MKGEKDREVCVSGDWFVFVALLLLLAFFFFFFPAAALINFVYLTPCLDVRISLSLAFLVSGYSPYKFGLFRNSSLNIVILYIDPITLNKELIVTLILKLN